MNASQGLYAEIPRTKAGLPVYIFGSDGVRSSQLSAAITPAERAALSGLSESDSEELATSPDYSRLAKLILDSISRAARRLSRSHRKGIVGRPEHMGRSFEEHDADILWQRL